MICSHSLDNLSTNSEREGWTWPQPYPDYPFKFTTAAVHSKDNGLSPLWSFLCPADWPFVVSRLLVAHHQPLTICSLCFRRQLFVAVWNTFISLGIYVLAAMPTSIVNEISF